MQTIDARRYGSMAALSCFYLAFLGGEYLFDQRVAMFAEASTVALAESAVVGVSVAGFLLYPVALRFARRAKHAMLCAAGLVSTACVFLLGAGLGPAATYAAGGGALLCMGFIGAAAHDAVAASSSNDASKGLAGAVGAAYGVAILLQVGLQAVTGDGLLRGVFLALVSASSAALSATTVGSLQTDKNPAVASDRVPDARALALLTATVALMTCVFSTLNVTLTNSHAAGQIDLGSWSRLFLAASALASGLVFDRLPGYRRPLVMALVSTLSCFAIFSAYSGGPVTLSAVVFYAGSGMFVVFFTTEFMQAGRGVEPMGLWPSMGRVANNVVSLLIAAPALALVSEAHELAASAVVLVVLAGIYATVFLLQEREAEVLRVPTTNSKKGEVPATLDPAQKLSAYAAAHGLTPRETEVLEALTTSDASMQDIARGLYISRSALYRHISSICERVGVQNRQALLLHYFSWDANPKKR